MIKRLTPRTKRALQQARVEAIAWNHHYLGCEHLLLGILMIEDCIAASILKACQVDSKQARQKMSELICPGPKSIKWRFFYSKTPKLRKVIRQAMRQEPKILGHRYMGTEHLLLALINEPENMGLNILKQLGLDTDKVPQMIQKFIQPGR